MEKGLYQLKIDPKFRSLIRPLYPKEYQQLEENLMRDGCRDPIITWNGYIIDGHNRYEICTRRKIPFAVLPVSLDCREAAEIWICTNQLGRRNLADEARHFLIGKQYEAEKVISMNRNPQGVNQHSVGENRQERATHRRTAQRIGEENHISGGSVEKYATYAKAVDEIQHKNPEMAASILAGKYKISHNNVLELAKLPEEKIEKVRQRIESLQKPMGLYGQIRTILQTSEDRIKEQEPLTTTVKDMPKYDPDAEIVGLSLTVPSWTSSLERIRQKDLSDVSDKAKQDMAKNLNDLKRQIDILLNTIGAAHHGRV